jgi:hypothetical protein
MDAAEHLHVALDPFGRDTDLYQRQRRSGGRDRIAVLVERDAFDDNGEAMRVSGTTLGRIGEWRSEPCAPVRDGVADGGLIFAAIDSKVSSAS